MISGIGGKLREGGVLVKKVFWGGSDYVVKFCWKVK